MLFLLLTNLYIQVNIEHIIHVYTSFSYAMFLYVSPTKNKGTSFIRNESDNKEEEDYGCESYICRANH